MISPLRGAQLAFIAEKLCDERFVVICLTVMGAPRATRSVKAVVGQLKAALEGEPTSMSEKFWHLTNCDVFGGLAPEEIKRLEACSRTRSFPAKSPVYLPADQTDSVFLLTSGRAKVCHLTEGGKQSILAFIEPGELFGELALIDAGERDEYVETVESSAVVMIPGEAVRQMMVRHADVSLGITRIIGLRRKRIERRLKQLLFLSNRQRLTHLLLELAEQYGRAASEGIELRIGLSHQDLANIIGSTRETVTVVLGQLQLEGLVRVKRRRITLRDAKRLAESVDRSVPQPTRQTPTPPQPSFLAAQPTT